MIAMAVTLICRVFPYRRSLRSSAAMPFRWSQGIKRFMVNKVPVLLSPALKVLRAPPNTTAATSPMKTGGRISLTSRRKAVAVLSRLDTGALRSARVHSAISVQTVFPPRPVRSLSGFLRGSSMPALPARYIAPCPNSIY